MKYIALLFCCCFSFSAWAGSSQKLCETINHVPADDVTYRPSPNVVPADLNAVPISLGDVEIPLNTYLVKELDLNTSVSSTKLGSVTIKESGAVMYQGRNISSNVVSLCGTSKKVVVQPVKVKIDNGQVPVEPVKSMPLETVNSDPSTEGFSGGFGQDHINASYND
jgi:hypothetical protein